MARDINPRMSTQITPERRGRDMTALETIRAAKEARQAERQADRGRPDRPDRVPSTAPRPVRPAAPAAVRPPVAPPTVTSGTNTGNNTNAGLPSLIDTSNTSGGGGGGGGGGGSDTVTTPTDRFTNQQYADAGQFILANINNPAVIQQRAQELGLTPQELLTAARTVNPNITMDQVNQFMAPPAAPPAARFTPDQYSSAGQFILANLNNPTLIAQRAQEMGLTNQDLLTAAQTVNPNITMDQVGQFMGGANTSGGFGGGTDLSMGNTGGFGSGSSNLNTTDQINSFMGGTNNQNNQNNQNTGFGNPNSGGFGSGTGGFGS